MLKILNNILANIRKIMTLVKELDQPSESDKAELYFIKLNHVLAADARKIIENAKKNAVKASISVGYRCIGLWDSASLRRNNKGRNAQTMAHTLSRTLPCVWNQNMAADLVIVSWSVRVSFIENIQLRPQCGRN